MTYAEIKENKEVKSYIMKADEAMEAIGFTEHSFAHCTLVAEKAGSILRELGYDDKKVELAKIAGYMHDIGNMVNRVNHAQSGALIAFRLLDKLGMPCEDVAQVVMAIGNHDDDTAYPVNEIAAALIIADKCDVRRTRVRDAKEVVKDIHDRVNYSVKEAKVKINEEKTEIQLRIGIDTTVCPVAEYFEIFLDRMMLCRKAALKLNLIFSLRINGQRLM